jgi:hypothetical protein
LTGFWRLAWKGETMRTLVFAIMLAVIGMQLSGCSSAPLAVELSPTKRDVYVDKSSDSLSNKTTPAPARVVELRGEKGELAKVSLGQKQGVAKGLQLEFFVFADYSDVVAGATREPSTIAYGLATEVEENFSWIQVAEPEKLIVKRGHYVRISAVQPQGFIDKVKGLFKGKKKTPKEEKAPAKTEAKPKAAAK